MNDNVVVVAAKPHYAAEPQVAQSAYSLSVVVTRSVLEEEEDVLLSTTSYESMVENWLQYILDFGINFN